jgi:hypothetical protein
MLAFTMPDLPSQYWPNAEVGGSGFYIFDATATVTFNGVLDPIVGASISTRPSGTGELAPSSVSVTTSDGEIYITVLLSGGVASRNYIHQLVITTQSGQTIPVLIGQVCDPVLAIPPVPPAPSPAFGTAVAWNSSVPIMILTFNRGLSISSAAMIS